MSYTSRAAKGPPRAGPSTVCQKCLERGHYSFECKAIARPYASRPSRSQQLANPRLRSQITNAAPETSGILAKNRSKRRERSQSGDVKTTSRKRSRSSSRSSSVSTISTRSSKSPSPQRPRYDGVHEEHPVAQRDGHGDRPGVKRRRRTSSVSSDDRPDMTKGGDARITRARKRSISPQERGRRTERSRGESGQGVTQGYYTRLDETQDSRTNRQGGSSLAAAEGHWRRDGELPRNTDDDLESTQARGNNGNNSYNESGRIRRNQERSLSSYSIRVGRSTEQVEEDRGR